jgi:pectin methylesterase-like acyl-CoA thioesterase
MSSLNSRLLIVGNGPTADFDKIQKAIDAIGSSTTYPPATADQRYTIFVTPGIYREKIKFKSSFVDLVDRSGSHEMARVQQHRATPQ